MKQLKISLILCCFCFIGGVHAQESAAVSMPKSRMNVLKTNILSPLSIGFERGFGKHFSLGINGLYFPSMSFGTPEGATGHISLADPSTGFLAEARLYTSKTKAPLNGFYVGGYYQFRIIDVLAHKITTTSTITTDVKVTLPSDLTAYGLMIGSQRIRAKGFTTDFSFGVGYYSLGNIPTVSNESSEAFKALSDLSKRKSGISPRLGLSLGYAF
jgi:Protein of unknown function (DUF3575)